MYKNQNVPNQNVPIFGQNIPKPKRTQFVINTNHTLLHIFCTIKTKIKTQGRKEMFSLTMLSTFIYGYNNKKLFLKKTFFRHTQYCCSQINFNCKVRSA